MAKRTKSHCVYEYKHKTNKKKVYYIGQRNKSNDARIHSINGIHPNKFTIKVLHSHLTAKQANKLEKLEIEKHNCIWPNGFNHTTGSKSIFKFSKKSKRKMSNSAKGNNSASGKRTGQTLKNIQKGLKNRKNKSKEVKKGWKTRRKNSNDKPSKESNIKRSKSMKGNQYAKGYGAPKNNQNALGWIPDSKWRKTTSKRMKKTNPMKNPKTKLKFAKRYLKNAKQRLIEARNFSQYKINGIKRQIKNLQEKIKELKLLISQ